MQLIPLEDRQLIIPESIYLGLEDIAAEKRKKADELIKPLITPKSVAQKLLALAVEANRRKVNKPKIHKEGETYIAECPEVGTVSQGKTVKEAKSNLKEATELYLDEFPEKNKNPSNYPPKDEVE